ncbi:MAG: monovalent cation/H(+) antiporter subunit G [Spirochaetota bacterium]
MNEYASLIFIGIGVLFDFFGCLGLLRLPDVYNRLQSATKCVTLGTWSILFGVFLYYGFIDVGVKALLCIPLIFFAATVAAHALIRGSHIFGISMWEKSVIDDYEGERGKER